jgi:hypothetical protein
MIEAAGALLLLGATVLLCPRPETGFGTAWPEGLDFGAGLFVTFSAWAIPAQSAAATRLALKAAVRSFDARAGDVTTNSFFSE